MFRNNENEFIGSGITVQADSGLGAMGSSISPFRDRISNRAITEHHATLLPEGAASDCRKRPYARCLETAVFLALSV